MLVDEGEVELELAGEVLVEHRFGDARAGGDVVHRGLVVAVLDEDAGAASSSWARRSDRGSRWPRAVTVAVVGHRFPFTFVIHLPLANALGDLGGSRPCPLTSGG